MNQFTGEARRKGSVAFLSDSLEEIRSDREEARVLHFGPNETHKVAPICIGT